MFSNFINGAVVTQHEHCGHTHSCVTPGFVQKDDYGNIARLQWTPETRFSFDLTSDTWIPVPEGSVVFNQTGQNPLDTTATCNTYAYNTADYKCWKNDCGTWVEQTDVFVDTTSSTAILFSQKSKSTRAIIKNFREEVVRTFDNIGNTVNIVVDDTLAQELLQGYYNIDMYVVGSDTIRYVRRIAVSIGNYVDKTNNINCGCNTPPSNIIPNPSLDSARQDAWELNRAFISVSNISERDSLDCRALPHGKMVRVSSTPNGVKYYSWDQITYTWKEEIFQGGSCSVVVDKELSKESENAISNSTITKVIEEVKTSGEVEALTETEYISLLNILE